MTRCLSADLSGVALAKPEASAKAEATRNAIVELARSFPWHTAQIRCGRNTTTEAQLECGSWAIARKGHARRTLK